MDIPPGTQCFITRDIQVGGKVAFSKGEVVTIEKISPNAQMPQNKYVVLSQTLQQRFQLSDANLTPAQQPQVVTPPLPQTPQTARAKRSKILLALTAVIAVVVIIAVIVIVLTMGKKQSTQTTSSKTISKSTTPATTFEEMGIVKTDIARSIPIYVSKPTKAEIEKYCQEKKVEYVDNPSTGRSLYMYFFDDRTHTPTFVGGVDIPPEDQPFQVASYFFNKANGETRLDFNKAIP